MDITHDADNHRYVITVDGTTAGFAAYTPREGVVDFDHTEIDPAFQGQGLSKPLIKAALDDVAASGHRIHTSCSAVARFVEKQPEYQKLVA